MLSIRYQRVGRRNQAFFRIVLTESSKPAKSGSIKVLGWYNPHTKESSLNKEEILRNLDNGAQPSNSVARLLEANKIKHKMINYIQDAPKATKKKKGEEDKKPAAPAAAPEEATEALDEAQDAYGEAEAIAETPAEAIPEETSAETEAAPADEAKPEPLDEARDASGEAEDHPKADESGDQPTEDKK